MDIIHHTLIGVAGYQSATDANMFPQGVAFLLGSIFPDLDVIFMALGKRFYLKNHQALTHSLPLSPLYALMLASPLFIVEGFSWSLAIMALLGLWLHIALDWCNTYRIAPFAPFSYRRYSLDAIFFIDLVTLTLTSGFYALYYLTSPSLWVTTLYGALFLLYLLLKLWLQQRVRLTKRVVTAIPSSLNPFSFFLFCEDESHHHSFHYNLLSGHLSHRIKITRAAPTIEAMAEKSRVYHDMKKICRALRIVNIQQSEQKTVIHASDLAVRNFGGRFGQTVLIFDKSGELVSEVANI